MKVPGVQFHCGHNSGRSQRALGLLAELAGNRAVGWSGGSEPKSELNKAVVEAMAEIGIDISNQFPKPWATEFFSAADVVVTMACGEVCPRVPGSDRGHFRCPTDWSISTPGGTM